MARTFAALRTLLACALLQSFGAGCAHRSSSVTALAPPGNVAQAALDPCIACDPAKHEVLLSWIAGDSTSWRVWFSRSADRGATWSVPVAVSPVGERLRLEPESSPRMVCDDTGRLGIAWSAWAESTLVAVRMTDLRFASSFDGGRTWSEPVTVNDDTTSGAGSQSFQDLAIRTEGGLYAAWLDSRPGLDRPLAEDTCRRDASIWFARSEDFGAHWGANIAHWSNVVPNSRVSVVVTPGGDIFAAFRKHYRGGIRDVVLGRPGGPPVRLYLDAWRIHDCPPSSPAIALSRDGTLRMAWYTGAPARPGVWFRQAVPELLDSTSAPVAVLVGDGLPTVHIGIGEGGMSGTLLALDADSAGTGQLTLARVDPAGRGVAERFVVPGTHGASYPGVATERASSVAYVVWTIPNGGHSALRLARWTLGR
jgi:hypothetical protein